MSEHKHGTMDVTSQSKTFDGFIRWVIGVGLFSIGTLIFMALVNA